MRLRSAGRSASGAAPRSPRAEKCRASPRWSAAVRYTLLGTRLCQLARPPTGSADTRLTSAPSADASSAAVIPAGPPPMTIRRVMCAASPLRAWERPTLAAQGAPLQPCCRDWAPGRTVCGAPGHEPPTLSILRACEEIVASGPRARRTERSDETYQVDRRGASTAQRRYRDAQQIYSQALSTRRRLVSPPCESAVRRVPRRARPRRSWPCPISSADPVESERIGPWCRTRAR